MDESDLGDLYLRRALKDWISRWIWLAPLGAAAVIALVLWW